MNNRTRISILLLLGAFIFLCTVINSHANSYAKEVRYHYIDLGTLSGDFSWSNGINNRGQVVGVSQTDLGALRAFVWTRNEMRELESGESDYMSMAWSLNDRGQAVGFATGSDNRMRAILWDYAGLHELETPEGTESNAVSINKHGEIVGYLTLPDGTGETYRAALWDSEGITDIHPSD